MDVLKMIQDLLDERNRIDATIAKLEALQSLGRAPSAGRRGRKAMSLTEREEVSRRMRNYWDRRRQNVLAAEGMPAEGPGTDSPATGTPATGTPGSEPAPKREAAKAGK